MLLRYPEGEQDLPRGPSLWWPLLWSTFGCLSGHFPARLHSPTSRPPEPLPVSSRPPCKTPFPWRPLNPCLREEVLVMLLREKGHPEPDVRVKRKLENKQKGGGNALALEVQRPPPRRGAYLQKKKRALAMIQERTDFSHLVFTSRRSYLPASACDLGQTSLYLAPRLSSLRQLFC